MRLKLAKLAGLLILLAGAGPLEGNESDLVVHEWGTFLAMSGSDGVTLDGMYHEEHALPAFVHARGRDQLRPRSIFLKGETPVIYFYTAREQNAHVEVKFPRGTWTQWYPEARFVLPRLASLPLPATDGPRDGRIAWDVQIVPPPADGLVPRPPATSADALWDFARQVDAAFVKTVARSKPTTTFETERLFETERFLFYRGLGTATLPLRMTADSGGTLSADEHGLGVRHVFVLRVEGGKGVYTYRPALAPGETIRGVVPSMDDARPVAAFDDALADDLAGRLVASGLYPKEARAMVNTWRSSYFGTDGVRVLFVLPQGWTDDFIPLTISPEPRSVTRVMVGRIELLTPERERLAEAAVRDLASPDPSKRLAAFETLKAQGRYVEPIVRRVLKTTGDEALRVLCRRLLLADFVTDLKSAVRSPSATGALPAGMVPNEDPVHVRARLAGLLREVGLDSEAKAEGVAVLAELGKRTPLPAGSCESRHDLRAAALANEGAGDDLGAADRYGKLVNLAALAARGNDCVACHRKSGTFDADRLGDWWAGGAFARAVVRSGGLAGAIAADEADLTTPARREAARLRLAYLYEAGRRGADSEAMWKAIRASLPPVVIGEVGANPAIPKR